MDFKVVCLAALLVLSGCGSVQADKGDYSGEDYFKNYALSTCISDGYESQEVISDAAAAARGYLELGDLPIEAHTEATLLGREYLKKKYRSKSGVDLVLMKCIDFYHSDELDLLYKKYK